MKNKFGSLVLSLILLATVSGISKTAYADCQPIYGGGETCTTQGSLMLNKTVQNPVTGAFVENLSVNDPRYNPDQSISFDISVTNGGTATINQTTVTDTFPTYVKFVSGPGNFNSSTNQLVFTLSNLNPNETRIFTVTGKVDSMSSLPSNQGVTCDVNQSAAVADNGQTASSNAQFCIQENVPTPVTPSTTKGGLPIFPVPQQQFSTPATGPEALPLIGIFGSAISGFIIRKKSSK